MFFPSAVAASDAGTGELYTLVAAADGGDTGYKLLGAIGSWTPTSTIFGEYSMGEIYTLPTTQFRIAMGPPIIADNDASWRQIRMTGIFQSGSHSVVLNRSERGTYIAGPGGDFSEWRFTNMPHLFAVGESYEVEIIR